MSLRWNLAAVSLIAATIATVVIPIIGAESGTQVGSRPVQKAPDPVPAPAASGPVAWELPPGWTAAPVKPMRLANFAVQVGDVTGDCGLFIFPGGGDRLANVNRWRGQAGLPPLAEADLAKELADDRNGLGTFQWLTVRGESKAFLAALMPTPQGQCFVKLEVPPASLDAARDGFLAFCRSLKPGSP